LFLGIAQARPAAPSLAAQRANRRFKHRHQQTSSHVSTQISHSEAAAPSLRQIISGTSGNEPWQQAHSGRLDESGVPHEITMSKPGLKRSSGGFFIMVLDLLE
jgi:hypothetical protein